MITDTAIQSPTEIEIPADTETDTLTEFPADNDTEAETEPTSGEIAPAGTWFLTSLIWAAVVLAREGIATSATRIWSLLRERFSSSVGADAGMSTVEYAVGTIAAAAFGAVLYTVVSGDSIPDALSGIIERALSTSV